MNDSLNTRDIDLLEIFDRLNETYFNNEIQGGIGWRNIRIGRKDMTMGVCETTERFIRINTVLRDERVPFWFVEYIVYHEMLHLKLGVKHDAAFTAEEQKFPKFLEALEFIDDHITEIMRDHAAYRKFIRETS